MTHQQLRRTRFALRLRTAIFASLAVAPLLTILLSAAAACPFCDTAGQTLSEETASADVVVLAKLIAPTGAPKVGESDIGAIGVPDPDSGSAKFRVVEVLKGKNLMDGIEEIDVTFYGDGDPKTIYRITGVGTTSPLWTTPLPMTDAALEYVKKMPDMTVKGADRLEFYQKYLEATEPMLAQDAYDEFARAPYQTLVGLKDRMDHEQLLDWIKDPKVPPTRRRLYLTMLGVCGSDEDANALEELIRSEDDETKSALDATVASYLTLKGADGLPLIENLFLKDANAKYIHTYATIMALRFHARESDVIPRERVMAAMRHVLDRADLADQIIPDLARWEDWSVLDRLVAMFKSDDKELKWVKIPVVNYLMAAQRADGDVAARAKTAMEDLTEFDPETVKRAKAYFAFGSFGSARASETKGNASREAADAKKADAKKEKDKQQAGAEASADRQAASEATGEEANNATDTAVGTNRVVETAEDADEPAADAGAGVKEAGAGANETGAGAKKTGASDSAVAGAEAAEEKKADAANKQTAKTNGAPGAAKSPESSEEDEAGPSRLTILGATAVVGLLLLVPLWWILTGAGQGRA